MLNLNEFETQICNAYSLLETYGAEDEEIITECFHLVDSIIYAARECEDEDILDAAEPYNAARECFCPKKERIEVELIRLVRYFAEQC